MKRKFAILLFIGMFFAMISSCKKPSNPVLDIETGTVTDISGHTYKTVKIGKQWWMAEDLRVTKYCDSSFIALVGAPPTDTTWSQHTTGAYCNNLDPFGNVIGVFYNYYAISDPRGIAPIGWHIPSDDEWKEMEQHLGMSAAAADNTGWRGTHEGEKLKVVRGTINGWSDYGNIWSTNESGFSALAGGCRMFNGSFGDPGQYSTGFWWTISTQSTDKAWYRYLDYKNANVFRYYGLKTYGFSIRCVKD
ncbi:MAG: fibrobacter succinogenes major paralogous domain-containing protein [Bacteroidetes bacterium]|nr:fibrobacter succinogenes major paralogous domain-containing protein [Bacteroidota bacterium]